MTETEDISIQTRTAMEVLADSIRSGIEIRDRNYHGKMYPNSFVGCEAVEWMLSKGLVSTESEAVDIGNLLMEEGLIFHVTGEHVFKNRYLFYRFQFDELSTGNELRTSGWLKKRSRQQKKLAMILNIVNWKLRFFKINGAQLEYYENANETSLKGIFTLQPDMEILDAPEDEKQFKVGNKLRIIHLQTLTVIEKTQWISSIQNELLKIREKIQSQVIRSVNNRLGHHSSFLIRHAQQKKADFPDKSIFGIIVEEEHREESEFDFVSQTESMSSTVVSIALDGQKNSFNDDGQKDDSGDDGQKNSFNDGDGQKNSFNDDDGQKDDFVDNTQKEYLNDNNQNNNSNMSQVINLNEQNIDFNDNLNDGMNRLQNNQEIIRNDTFDNIDSESEGDIDENSQNIDIVVKQTRQRSIYSPGPSQMPSRLSVENAEKFKTLIDVNLQKLLDTSQVTVSKIPEIFGVVPQTDQPESNCIKSTETQRPDFFSRFYTFVQSISEPTSQVQK